MAKTGTRANSRKVRRLQAEMTISLAHALIDDGEYLRAFDVLDKYLKRYCDKLK